MTKKATMSCLRCQGTMEEGFILDGAHNGVYQSVWMKGPPQPGGFWKPGVETDGVKFYVVTWRCPNCGTLESRATEHTPTSVTSD